MARISTRAGERVSDGHYDTAGRAVIGVGPRHRPGSGTCGPRVMRGARRQRPWSGTAVQSWGEGRQATFERGLVGSQSACAEDRTKPQSPLRTGLVEVLFRPADVLAHRCTCTVSVSIPDPAEDLEVVPVNVDTATPNTPRVSLRVSLSHAPAGLGPWLDIAFQHDGVHRAHRDGLRCFAGSFLEPRSRQRSGLLLPS